jgi:hypothetical protein
MYQTQPCRWWSWSWFLCTPNSFCLPSTSPNLAGGGLRPGFPVPLTAFACHVQNPALQVVALVLVPLYPLQLLFAMYQTQSCRKWPWSRFLCTPNRFCFAMYQTQPCRWWAWSWFLCTPNSFCLSPCTKPNLAGGGPGPGSLCTPNSFCLSPCTKPNLAGGGPGPGSLCTPNSFSLSPCTKPNLAGGGPGPGSLCTPNSFCLLPCTKPNLAGAWWASSWFLCTPNSFCHHAPNPTL